MMIWIGNFLSGSTMYFYYIQHGYFGAYIKNRAQNFSETLTDTFTFFFLLSGKRNVVDYLEWPVIQTLQKFDLSPFNSKH